MSREEEKEPSPSPASLARDRLRQTGVLERLNDRLRFGTRLAVSELITGIAEADIAYKPFSGVDRSELSALQAVYRYLESVRLRRTLSCLSDESCVPFTARDGPGLPAVVGAGAGLSAAPRRHALHPIEPPAEISRAAFEALPLIVSVESL
jgi:hypothetical protein